MSNQYRSDRWNEFRAEVIELDGGLCRDCKRGSADGLILQVHHKKYIPNKQPWDYPYSDCETLCKGCHAVRHGKIRPSIGWDFLGQDDLGDLCGNCECCGTQIRHVFWIQHPYWEPMGVGTFCCDHLTGTEIASNHMESIRRFHTREVRFLSSRRWKVFPSINRIRQKGIQLDIVAVPTGFQIVMDGQQGKKVLISLDDAKRAAFEVIENGKAEAYLKKFRSQK